MATLQVIEATKADSSFISFEAAQFSLNTDSSGSTLKTYYENAQSSGNMTATTDFDADTQTLTYTRTWDETAYNEYRTAHQATLDSARAAAESAGWTITETISTV